MLFLFRKTNKSLRFCIDFRHLNSLTVRDAYGLPRITESFDALHGATWFTKSDLKSAYWQVELEEADKFKTAFVVGQLGFFECNRMPFELTNAPATFQRLVESTMADLNLDKCLLYLDVTVIFSRTYEQHLERLETVFACLNSVGLKLKPSKCNFFQHTITYLGYVVSSNGISTDPDKVACVTNWPVPTTIKEVQSFQGFVGVLPSLHK